MKRYPACIMSTCCVPWDTDGHFLEAVFRRSIRSTLKRGTSHLYLFGTAGEGYAVSDTQFDRIVYAFSEEMRQVGAEPMVGIISLSLVTMIERIERCISRGVKLFQISLPSWGALDDLELFKFFELLCGRFSDCKFMHYNLPRTKRLVTGREYGKLATMFPNLVATKNTGDSLAHIQSLQEDATQLQHFFSEKGYVHGSLFGECGILASFVMNWPKLKTHFDAGRLKDINALTEFSRECDLILKTLFEAVPIGKIDGSYDKLFEKMYHPDFPLRLLPPYVGSTDQQFDMFVKLLGERLPHWIPSPD